MGLTSDTTNAVSKAFDTSLSDAVKSFTYVSLSSVFDETTNTVVETQTEYTSRGVFARYKRSIVKDADTVDATVKIILLQSELDITPVKHDKIIQGTNEYIIEAKKADPANITWVLLCRQ